MRDRCHTYLSRRLVLLLGASSSSASLGRLQPRLPHHSPCIPTSVPHHSPSGIPTSVRRSSRSHLGAQLLVPILRAVVTLGVSGRVTWGTKGGL